MTAAEAFKATTKWGEAYQKDPKNPRNALGYAATLRTLGNKQRAFEVLQTAYAANPNHGELAAEMGKTALDAGQMRVAQKALKTADEKGIRDWKILSAQGTLAAKKGEYATAQKYYQAALKKNPNSSSVINNLALSYTLDGKAKTAEKILRTASNEGHDDKRLRQNLALVLGVQGKYKEARKVAAIDVGETQAKKSVAQLQNMLSSKKPASVASARPKPSSNNSGTWSPFASNAASQPTPQTVKMVSSQPPKQMPVVQMVKPVDEVVSTPPKVAQATPGSSSYAKTSTH